MSALDDLKAAVAAEESTEGKVLQYLQNVPNLIKEAAANNADSAELEALAAQIQGDTANMAAALKTVSPEPADGNVAPENPVGDAGNVTKTQPPPETNPAVDQQSPTDQATAQAQADAGGNTTS